jgi:hypothetical protein
MLRFEDLRVRDQQALDRDFFNRRYRLNTEAIAALGEDVASVTGDTDCLVALGLNRVNEVLGPLLAKVQTASENGFLVATSSTPLTVTKASRPCSSSTIRPSATCSRPHPTCC